MKQNENGTQYNEYRKWGSVKVQAYDYEKDGLLQHILSNKIVASNNIILKIILRYYEKSIIMLLKYVDELKNFKNYHWKNR